MRLFYTTVKYLSVTLWSVFVIAPFLWAITTSFKDFQSVTSGATYIPWVDFEPTLEGWRSLFKSPAQGGIAIVEPFFNSVIVTAAGSGISIVLGTLAAYSLSRFTFRAGPIRNGDITFFHHAWKIGVARHFVWFGSGLRSPIDANSRVDNGGFFQQSTS